MKSKIFPSVLIVLILAFFSYMLLNVFFNLSFFDLDDVNSTINSYPLYREENGRYVANFISRVALIYLPQIFGIHIQNFYNTFGAVFYVIIINLLIISCTLFSLLNNKKNFILFPFLMLIPIRMFIEYCFDATPIYYTIASFQYGYVLASVFGISFLLIFYCFMFYDNRPKEKYILPISILAFCAGNSSQIVCFSVAVTIFLYFIYSIFENKFDNVKIKDKFLNKSILIPIIAFFSGLFLMIFCPGFHREVAWRHAESFQQICEIFIPFVNSYLDVVFIRKLYYLKMLFIIFLFIVLFSKNELCSLKKVFKSLFLLFGVWTYFFLLILAGPTFAPPDLNFWLHEPFYTFFYNMVLSVTIISFLRIFFEELEIKIVHLLVSIVISFLSINFIFGYKDYYQDKISELKSLRETVFKCEKILITSIYKNKDVIHIPSSCYYSGSIICEFNRYKERVYNNKKFLLIEKMDNEQAYQEFYSEGGNFTVDELEKTDFQKFYDKEFILKKKENIK